MTVSHNRRAVMRFCALFVYLLIFHRMTNNGPIAVVGDSALQTQFSSRLVNHTVFSCQNWTHQRRLTMSKLGVWFVCRLGRVAKDQGHLGLPPRNETIISNIEIALRSGESIEWQGVGVSLCRQKNIDLSRKRPLVHHYNTPNSHGRLASCAFRVGGR